MGRRAEADESEKGSEITARLRHLRDLIWDGNNSRMGRELGNISHPVISRVLAGDQPPPGKLLEALAKWPGLNVRWLFAGEGEPLNERGLGAGGGHFSPIARELLPGRTRTAPRVADADEPGCRHGLLQPDRVLALGVERPPHHQEVECQDRGGRLPADRDVDPLDAETGRVRQSDVRVQDGTPARLHPRRR